MYDTNGSRMRKVVATAAEGRPCKDEGDVRIDLQALLL